MAEREKKYPDIKAIISGAFKPLDETRCLVCGAELRKEEQWCDEVCHRLMLKVQRSVTDEYCSRLIAAAQLRNDPRLI